MIGIPFDVLPAAVVALAGTALLLALRLLDHHAERQKRHRTQRLLRAHSERERPPAR